MKTNTNKRKKRRLKKGVKKVIIIITLLTSIILLFNIMNKKAEAEHQEELIKYYNCIQEQAEKQGYIIRSQCSVFYSQYDEELKIEYKKIGYDLFLKK